MILLNGVFALAEVSLISSRKARLEAQANKGDKKAKEALELANHPDKFISTAQFGITLIGILNGIFSGENIKGKIIVFLNQYPALQHYSNGIATTIVVIIVTYFSLVLGELVPKRIGLSNPESFAKFFAAPMRITTIVSYPFVWLISKSSNLFISLFRVRTNNNQVTEEEIKAIINEGTEQGTIEEAEQEIIQRVFHLSDRNITSLMTHRSDIMWLEANTVADDIKQFSDDKVHSVYPVGEGSIDNIKGIASLKDIFKAAPGTPLSAIMKPALYVPDNNTAYQLLEMFKQKRSHFAFIVDEYGTLQGVITLNDILDALVGEIPQIDEENYEIVKRQDGSYLVDAQFPFYNFLSYFYRTEWADDDEQEFTTLAGFILHELERIPVIGDSISWRGFDFEIVDMDGHRIDKIMVNIPEDVQAEMEND